MIPTPMTELNAVNRLLEMIEEAPVNTLTTAAQDPDVADALNHLRQASYSFQASGWYFNTIPEITLVRDVDGTIFVPTNIVLPGYTVLSNRAVFNSETGTSTFTADITARAHRLFSFDELPAEAAEYVLVLAAESFLAHKAPGSDFPTALKRQAWAAFHRAEVNARNVSLPQSTLISNRPRPR